MDRTLVSTTTLIKLEKDEIRDHLSIFWSIAPENFDLIKSYEIRDALPIFSPNNVTGPSSSKVRYGIYQAGDYLTAGSQNGALLSGRLAAQELLFDKS
jgi:hypothetical protein